MYVNAQRVVSTCQMQDFVYVTVNMILYVLYESVRNFSTLASRAGMDKVWELGALFPGIEKKN